MKHTLTLDRLRLNLRSAKEARFNYQTLVKTYAICHNALIVNDAMQLIKSDRIDRYYLHSFQVWIDGKWVADLLTNCRQNTLTGTAMLEFTNETMYSTPGWSFYLHVLLTELGLCVASASYMEIAFDFQDHISFMASLSHMERHSSLDRHNKSPKYAPSKSRLTCHKLNNGSEYVFGKSGKKIAVYDKTEEIKHSGKDYIKIFHVLNGLNPDTSIIRVEARLTSQYLGKYIIALDELETINGLYKIFLNSVGDTFRFRELENYTFDMHRNKKHKTVSLLDFPDLLDKAPLPLKTTIDTEVSTETKNRMAVKGAVTRWLNNGQAIESEYVQYLISTLKAPKGTDWKTLISNYATSAQGFITSDRLERIGYIGNLT